MSISDINVEKGVSYNLIRTYTICIKTFLLSLMLIERIGIGMQCKPVTGSLPSAFHPIRFDEFYGAEYDTYGGGGCFRKAVLKYLWKMD